ncbi:hypothetical protein [Nonomuraea sp. NPDC049695]|uniref:hypothetical protein n=1 Tax=Nonomuraea sp. NPDC049695 TaxID=3154734 RepID=UPI0034268FA0
MNFPDAALSDDIEAFSYEKTTARFDLTRPGDLVLAVGLVAAAIQLNTAIQIAQVDHGRALPISPAYVPRAVTVSWNGLNNRFLLTVIRHGDGMAINHGPVIEITHP